MKNRILIIIDMLNGFCKKGALASPEFMQTIVPSIQTLLRREFVKNNRIIFLADSHKVNDEEFKIFPSHCISGTWESEVIDELKIDYMEIIYKNRYSGFFNTALETVLQKYSSADTEIVIAGNCTDICVHYTAEEFRNRDYNVIIPCDCVDTYDLTEEKCKSIGIPISKAHPANEINQFFFTKHFPNILGVKIINSIDEII